MKKITRTAIIGQPQDYGPYAETGHEFKAEDGPSKIEITYHYQDGFKILLVVGDRKTWFKGDEAGALINFMNQYFSTSLDGLVY